MTGSAKADGTGAFGFASRVPLEQAQAWVDAHTGPGRTEKIDPAGAIGRVLAGPVRTDTDWPEADCAAVEGYALRAADTEGASAYNPVPISLMVGGALELPPGSACAVASGQALPAGADAVLRHEGAQPEGAGMLDVLEPVARGAGVRQRGGDLRAGMPALPEGRKLRPVDLALLAALGCSSVTVFARPRIRLIRGGRGSDMLAPMLRALAGRDGAEVQNAAFPEAATGTDLILLTGDAGHAPAALLAAGGVLDLHGIALRPGGATGLGRIGAVPVVLLPEEAPDCLAAYDMLAARAIRRMAGLGAGLPYPVQAAKLARKLVSVLGFTDLAPVRLTEEGVAPAGTLEGAGVAAAVRADGFVVIPAQSEGFPPSAQVNVHLYEPT